MSRATKYIILSGLLALSGIAHAGDIRVTGQFVSEATSGPPLVVNSSDKVTGLNADKLDGFNVGDFATEGSGVGVHYKNLVGVPGKEINQDCAVNTGCFSGDDPGFPVTILYPGSYRLAGNLITNDKDTTLIIVFSNNVTLDLNGFSLRGPVSCSGSGSSLSCSPTDGSGHGINVANDLLNVAILNGAIRSMGRNGIRCGDSSHCRVEQISAAKNGFTGIGIRNGLVRECMAVQNNRYGIWIDSGAANNNLSDGNGNNGIFVNKGATVNYNSVKNNGNIGITAFNLSDAAITAIGNHVESNSGWGIFADKGSTVAQNTVRHNGDGGIFTDRGSKLIGNTVYSNDGNGIRCDGTCQLLDNSSFDNDGYGVEFKVSGAYGRNLITGNGLGTVQGTAVDIGGNVCDGGSCP